MDHWCNCQDWKTKDRVDLSGNSFGDAGAKIVAAELPTMQCSGLDVTNNDLHDAAAQALATNLSKAPKLRELYIKGNKIGIAGAQAIAAALPNTTLDYISALGNLMGSDGAKAIFSALSTAHLTRLNIGGNNIRPDAAKAIATALVATGTKITSLDLGINFLGDQGAQEIAGAFPQAKSLTSLTLTNNNISNTTQGQLKQAWETAGKPSGNLIL